MKAGGIRVPLQTTLTAMLHDDFIAWMRAHDKHKSPTPESVAQAITYGSEQEKRRGQYRAFSTGEEYEAERKRILGGEVTLSGE